MIENEKSESRILLLLKTEGAQSIEDISKILLISKEAVRLQMLKLGAKGEIQSELVKNKVGRPTKRWVLTDKAYRFFHDAHAELTVQMISTIKEELGEDVMEKLIFSREKSTKQRYEVELKKAKSLKDKIKRLAELRSLDGYMASFEKVPGGYLLSENHCPICFAASACQGFCRSELELFKDLLGEEYTVERQSHILAGAKSCVYKITEA